MMIVLLQEEAEPPLDAQCVRVWNRTETSLEVLAFPKEPSVEGGRSVMVLKLKAFPNMEHGQPPVENGKVLFHEKLESQRKSPSVISVLRRRRWKRQVWELSR